MSFRESPGFSSESEGGSKGETLTSGNEREGWGQKNQDGWSRWEGSRDRWNERLGCSFSNFESNQLVHLEIVLHVNPNVAETNDVRVMRWRNAVEKFNFDSQVTNDFSRSF